MITLIKIKLSSGKEIELTTEEFEEMKANFTEIKFIPLPEYPNPTPEQPYAPIWIGTGTGDPSFDYDIYCTSCNSNELLEIDLSNRPIPDEIKSGYLRILE